MGAGFALEMEEAGGVRGGGQSAPRFFLGGRKNMKAPLPALS